VTEVTWVDSHQSSVVSEAVCCVPLARCARRGDVPICARSNRPDDRQL